MSETPAPITLSSRPLKIEEVEAVARHGARIEISDEVTARIVAAREVVDRYARQNIPAYGLTTGLGAGVDTRLDADDLIAFQHRVPEARAVGVGEPLPRAVTRAMMMARIAGMAAGGSGVSLGVFRGLVAALNAGLHPVVPSLGSIGAADLAPLSHVARVLLGHGLAEVGGRVMPAGEALREAGLSPLALEPKDGHALVVANGLSVGRACLVVPDIERLFDWSLSAIALQFEAFRANLAGLDDRALAARPAFGQRQVAARLRDLMARSALLADGAARRLQDPLSYRCVPQVWGALRHALDEARQATDIEIASSGDNPVVLVEGGVMLSHGNFDMTAFVLSWERLGQAMAHCATATAHRCQKIMSPAMSDLPRFLTPRGQARSGFATVQKTISALEAEIRHLALPVSLSPLPAADGIEDHATMAPSVLAKTEGIVERLRLLVAIELVVAAQAADLRGLGGQLGRGGAAVYGELRRMVEPLDEDRSLSDDFLRVAASIASRHPTPPGV